MLIAISLMILPFSATAEDFPYALTESDLPDGYELSSINSELLATLLKSRDNQEAFYGMESEIQEYYESLED